jgi:hypothetical protein
VADDAIEELAGAAVVALADAGAQVGLNKVQGDEDGKIDTSDD